VRFALAAPARDPAHLLSVLRERLARVELPAPVESLALASEVTAPLAGRNLGLLPGDAPIPAVPLLDRLRARLGEQAVLRVAPLAEHRPERAWTERADTHAEAPAAPPQARRPAWLLCEPQPLATTFQDAPWVLRDGPERIESGWWDGGDIRRDYYVAESPQGETLWIYRDRRYGDDGEWFLHGVFA
jgi:protein ImuB